MDALGLMGWVDGWCNFFLGAWRLPPLTILQHAPFMKNLKTMYVSFN